VFYLKIFQYISPIFDEFLTERGQIEKSDISIALFIL